MVHLKVKDSGFEKELRVLRIFVSKSLPRPVKCPIKCTWTRPEVRSSRHLFIELESLCVEFFFDNRVV